MYRRMTMRKRPALSSRSVRSSLSVKMIAQALCLIAFLSGALHAYVIDGLVMNDWGINLTEAVTKGYLDAHTPTAGNDIDFITEDNADATRNTALWHGYWQVGPQYSAGNMCDAEALYFDNDATNAYIAIIQGLPFAGAATPAGSSPSYIWPGDIALNTDGDNIYEYGLNILSLTQATLMRNCSWQNGQYSGTPYQITGGQNVQTPISFAYSAAAINGHYVMEASIPLAALGLNAVDTVKNIGIHWTMSCGNDLLTLKADVNPVPIPEPSTFILMSMGLIGSLFSFGRKRYGEMRRVLDIIISVVALILALPLLLIAALFIKIDSPGPIFYNQVRVGVNRRRRTAEDMSGDRRQDDCFGMPFTIYKLRTMRADAEAKTGPVWAQQNDNRITKIGNFLRKTRIDEIPQFINVLLGEMSIVGPRPERPVFVKKLTNDIPDYEGRFDVKPGITGLVYIRKMNLLLDFNILFNTIGTVLFARGSR